MALSRCWSPGLFWIGLRCPDICWIGLCRLRFCRFGLRCLGFCWIGMCWTELCRAGLCWIGLFWTGLFWIGLSRAGLFWTGLWCLGLCRAGLRRIGLRRRITDFDSFWVDFDSASAFSESSNGEFLMRISFTWKIQVIKISLFDQSQNKKKMQKIGSTLKFWKDFKIFPSSNNSWKFSTDSEIFFRSHRLIRKWEDENSAVVFSPLTPKFSNFFSPPIFSNFFSISPPKFADSLRQERKF